MADCLISCGRVCQDLKSPVPLRGPEPCQTIIAGAQKARESYRTAIKRCGQRKCLPVSSLPGPNTNGSNASRTGVSGLANPRSCIAVSAISTSPAGCGAILAAFRPDFGACRPFRAHGYGGRLHVLAIWLDSVSTGRAHTLFSGATATWPAMCCGRGSRWSVPGTRFLPTGLRCFTCRSNSTGSAAQPGLARPLKVIERAGICAFTAAPARSRNRRASA